MTESQKEFLFRAMLKDLGVSYSKNSGYTGSYIRYDFRITKKFLFMFPNEYNIGHFVAVSENPEYYFYGMPQTNQKIVDLLKEYLDIENIHVIMQDNHPRHCFV